MVDLFFRIFLSFGVLAVCSLATLIWGAELKKEDVVKYAGSGGCLCFIGLILSALGMIWSA